MPTPAPINPLPSPFLHSPPLPSPALPSSHHPSVHLASRTTSRNQGAVTAKLCMWGGCKQPLSCTCGCFSCLFLKHTDWLFLWLVVAIGCAWLLSSVVSPVPFYLSDSWTHSLLLLLDLLHCLLVHLCPFPTTTSSSSSSSSSSSAPHVQHCAAPTPPFHFPLLLPLYPSTTPLHLDPVRLGRTAGGSPHSLLLVQDLSASGTETETTHSQCCGFGRKIFVKLLPVSALSDLLTVYSGGRLLLLQIFPKKHLH